MRAMSTCQLEGALPIIAELDLQPIFQAWGAIAPFLQDVQSGLTPEDLTGASTEIRLTPDQVTTALPALLPVLVTLGKAGEAKVIRRLATIARATDSEILESEGAPAKRLAMETEVAKLPVMSNLREVVDFFTNRWRSDAPTQRSSGEGTEPTSHAEAALDPQVDSPSAGS